MIIRNEVCIWWELAKRYRNLKNASCTVVRLLCNVNCLRYNEDHNVPHNKRICQQCTQNSVETTYLFVMDCHYYNDIRQELFLHIQNVLDNESNEMFNCLSNEMKFYVLLGLYFNFKTYYLEMLRCYSCYYLHKMYRLRCAIKKISKPGL